MTETSNPGLSMVSTQDETEQREFARNIVENRLPEYIEDNVYEINIQRGLDYTVDYDELVEGFVNGIDTWNAYIPHNIARANVHVEITASTIDTAKVTNTAGPGDVSQQPSWETEAWVDCFLEFNCIISSDGPRGGARINIRQQQDQ